MSRIVMEGVGMGAGAAIGRSIVERGFQSLTTPSQNTDIQTLSNVSEKQPNSSIVPPLHDDCEFYIKSYYLCLRNESGICDYKDCKKIYDDYVSCVMTHPIT
jgi:hypothetical protein